MAQIIGKITNILPVVTGESQRGTWSRGGFVIEVGDEYPRKVAFTMFGDDKIGMLDGLTIGRKVQVTFTPESREFNERWYTDLKCTAISVFEKVTATAAMPTDNDPDF